MLAGLGLFWVGAVLFCNGLWVLGKIGDKEISVIDVFVGSLTLLIALYLAFGPGANLELVKGATFLLLFTFTYLLGGLESLERCGRSGPWLVLPFRRHHLRSDLCADAAGVPWQLLANLVGNQLGVLGHSMVPVLSDSGGRADGTHQSHWYAVHSTRYLHWLDTRLSLGHRHDAWGGSHSMITSARQWWVSRVQEDCGMR